MKHYNRRLSVVNWSKALRTTLAILCWGAVLGLGACKTGKGGQQKKLTDAHPAKADSSSFAAGTLRINNAVFTTLSLNGKGNYQSGGSSINFNYRIHIEHGKRLWASLNVFGIEVIRLLASPEGVQVLDKINQKILSGSYDALGSKLGIKLDYLSFENLVAGNADPNPYDLIKRHKEDGKPDFSVQNNDYVLDYFLTPDTRKVARIATADSLQKASTELNYQNFTSAGGLVLPFSVAFKRDPEGIRVTLNHREGEVNTADLNFNFSVPPDYAQEKL